MENTISWMDVYQPVAPLSRNGQAVLVRDAKTSALLVRKAVDPSLEPTYRTLQKLKLNGIPQILGIERQDTALVILETYVKGKSIADLLDEGQTFTVNTVTAFMKSLCTILEPLHSQKPPLVHRDIKPEHLILDEANRLYLIDFNAARTAEPARTTGRDTVLMGTYGYAAPEQFGFGQSTPASDIYAIGVVANLMLTGKFPSEEISQSALRPVLDACLQIDPRLRIQNASELLRILSAPAIPANPEAQKAVAKTRPRKIRSDKANGLRPKAPRAPHSKAALTFGAIWIPFWVIFAVTEFGDLSGKALGKRIFDSFVPCTISILIYLFCINAGDIQRFFPFTGNENVVVRIAARAFWAFGLFVVLFFLFAALLTPLGGLGGF